MDNLKIKDVTAVSKKNPKSNADENMRKFEIILTKLIRFEIKLLGALFVAWVNYLWLVPFAARERGYSGAIGGEWLLIVAIFSAAYIGIGHLIWDKQF